MNNYLSAFVSIHSMQLRWAKLHPKFRPQLSGWAISMLALYQPRINRRNIKKTEEKEKSHFRPPTSVFHQGKGDA